MHEPRPAAAAALAWLTHPITCVALLLLLVNDQVLKAMWGTWWTGKLSDVAWLVVGPPLLATIMVGTTSVLGVRRPSARSCTWVNLAAVGTIFVVVKSTVAGATFASAALTVLAGPSVVLRDPTDLLTLPALALAWVVGRSKRTAARPAPGAGTRWTIRWLVVLPVAVFATAATSQMPPSGPTQLAVVDGVLMVGESSDSGPESATWYVPEDGSSWDVTYWSADEAEELVSRFVRAGGTVQDACVPASPSECFRVAERDLDALEAKRPKGSPAGT